ncbi:MAG TPA: bifunctional nuclease domain-containing protein [Candidatus Binataceae bacterium]|nr:bifunctional nuclease domain-containing protein [Candidatus Binataceae bacterium]
MAAAAVALIAIGCARGAGKAERGEVRVQVAGVRFDQDTGAHYMLLEDKSGGHSLPIVVGDEEARAIMFEMHGIRPQRPLPCELLLDVIEQTGNHVDRVVVADVRDQIYFARIYLDNGRYMIDSRPSDAIALAIGANAPIFVANKLFQTATPAHEAEPPPRTARAVGITVQELTPAMAEGFGVSPYSGVVVADTDAAARSAGLERGDIVTEADGSRVASAGDFMRIASAAAAGSRIELTVRRGTETHAIAVVIPPAANARR